MKTPEEALKQAQGCVDLLIEIVEQTVNAIDGFPINDHSIQQSIRGLLRVGQALHSARILSRLHRYQDVWVLTRVLTEAVINTAYLFLAASLERKRYTRHDDLTDAKWLQQLGSLEEVKPYFTSLPWEHLKQIHKALADGLYSGAKRSTWSENDLSLRAKNLDAVCAAELGSFFLIYTLAVKQGDAYVHSSPKAVGNQAIPIATSRHPDIQQIVQTCQGLAVACTSCYLLSNFLRIRFLMNNHSLAERFAKELNEVYAATARMPQA